MDILQGQALLRGVKQLLTRAGTGKKTDQQNGKKTDRLKTPFISDQKKFSGGVGG